MKKRKARVSFYWDRGAQWRWRLTAANGRIVADSDGGLHDRSDGAEGLRVGRAQRAGGRRSMSLRDAVRRWLGLDLSPPLVAIESSRREWTALDRAFGFDAPKFRVLTDGQMFRLEREIDDGWEPLRVPSEGRMGCFEEVEFETRAAAVEWIEKRFGTIARIARGPWVPVS